MPKPIHKTILACLQKGGLCLDWSKSIELFDLSQLKKTLHLWNCFMNQGTDNISTTL